MFSLFRFSQNTCSHGRCCILSPELAQPGTATCSTMTGPTNMKICTRLGWWNGSKNDSSRYSTTTLSKDLRLAVYFLNFSVHLFANFLFTLVIQCFQMAQVAKDQRRFQAQPYRRAHTQSQDWYHPQAQYQPQASYQPQSLPYHDAQFIQSKNSDVGACR